MMMSQRQDDEDGTGSLSQLGPRWARRRFLIAGLGLFACSIARAWADGTPGDPDVFTAYVADEIRRIVPGTPVTVTGTLSLDVGNSGAVHSLYLQRLFEVCQRNPDMAATFVDTFIQQMAAVARTPEPEVTRDTLRVIVRPEIYLKSEFDTLAGRATPVAGPLPGDLWLLGASDLPTAIKMLDSRDLARLGVSDIEALAIGKQNMRSGLKQTLEQAQAARVPGVNLITGDPYESSLLAFPDLWAPLAKASLGDLLVAVPAADVVLFSDTDKPDAVPALRDAVQTVMGKAERPLASTIFRWTAAGWVVLAP